MRNPFSTDMSREKTEEFYGGDDVRFCILDRLNSTNGYLKEIGNIEKSEGLVVVAEEQTGGRGRLGRSFSSPKGGLYMSVLLRPSVPDEDYIYITPAAALAVSRAVESVSGLKTGIKWVNDIYIADRKVAGILIERVVGESDFSVLGIGINVTTKQENFPPELQSKAASVFKDGADAPPFVFEKLCALVTKEFFNIYRELDKEAIAKEYKERSLLIGREVTVVNGRDSYPATVFDIDGKCRLGVELRDGTKDYLFCGEVSLRL